MSILTEYNEEQVLRNRFKEGREVGIAEGKEIGIIEGRIQNLLSQICRKLKKGKTAEQIAEELEEDIAVIRPLYDAAVPFAPEFDWEKIFQTLKF